MWAPALRRRRNAPGKALELALQPLELLVVEAFKVDQARPGGGRGWGQYPTGRIGPVLLIVLILVLIGRI